MNAQRPLATVTVFDRYGTILGIYETFSEGATFVEWEATKARVRSHTDASARAVRRWSDARRPDDVTP